jgi:cell division protein FtsZ
MSGARGLLINITGGEDLTLFEVDQAANRIREEVDEEANVIFGSAVDDSLAGRIRVSVVATGIETPRSADQSRPKLVAVGGGGAAPAPQPIVRNGAPAAAAPPFMPGAIQAPASSPLRHVSSQYEAPTAPAPAADAQAQPPLQQRATVQRQPHLQPQSIVGLSAKANLFADQQRPTAMPSYPVAQLAPEPVRPSLFNAVTGAFRRRVTQPATQVVHPQPLRHDPVIEEYQTQNPHVSVRQTSAAFLRRQHS